VVDDVDMRTKAKSSLPSSPTLETLIAQGAPRAFESVRDEIAAVPADALHPVNLDVSRAARRGLVVSERIKPLLSELSIMSHLDLAKVEKLPTYALALLYAHEQAEAPDERAIPLAGLLVQAVPLRADLLQTAEMLAHFGLVSRERVAFIRRGQGHADIAGDLLALALLLLAAWQEIQNKVVVTREDVEGAIPLSAQLQQAIGARESDDDPLSEPTDARHVRAQALTLFMGAYDECRRGVSHLRWHQGDAAVIVPSLYPRRGRSKRDEVADDLRDAGSVSEPADEPTPAGETGPVAETAAGAAVGG
jgi:hypothetical protein